MTISKICLQIFALLVFAMPLSAQEGPDKSKRDLNNFFANVSGAPQYASFSINNFNSWLRADGISSQSLSGTRGSTFPYGTADVIYQDGFLWGGKAYLDAAKTKPAPFGQIIRVGGTQYRTGCRAGRIIGFGANATPADTNAADSRIYRIRRDYFTMSADELRRDAAAAYEIDAAAVTEAQMQAIRAQYAKDWTEWPVPYGAPYIDRNHNDRFDPPPPFSSRFNADSLIAGKYDEPGIAGADPNFPADQVIWTVFNDLDRNQTTALYGSEPLGLEAQVTLWGYKSAIGTGDFFFRRLRIINKGGVAIDASGNKGAFTIDSLYVGQWEDVDLGNFADDLLGCDTLRSMGYVYNGDVFDNEFRQFNLPPPAVGFDFVQGLRVPVAGASAIFDLSSISGWKNLGMTSFSPKFTGSAFSDPPGGSYQNGTLRWYKWLRGFLPMDGRDQYYSFPPGITPNLFPFSGDPVAGTGFLDGLGTAYYSLAPGDRRMTISCGPIGLAPGDTQEVVVAVAAGLGADRLSSIIAMRHVDDLAQSFYHSLLAVSPLQFSVEVIYPSQQAELKITAASQATNLAAIQATLHRRDQSQAAAAQLFDDGMHGDGAANDGVFANHLTLAREPAALYLNAVVINSMQMSFRFERVLDLITTAGEVAISGPVIFSDNLNQDGLVNPGENVRYGFMLSNNTPFDLANLRVTPLIEFQAGKNIAIKQLAAGGKFTLSYDPADPNTFLSFEVPSNYADTVFHVAASIFDQNYNRWQDTLLIPVVPFKNTITPTKLFHARGKADGSFDIRLVNPAATKNHLYAIYGVAAADSLGNRFITLKDSTDGRILLFKHPVPDTLGHNMPVVDGFKIFRGSIPDQTRGGMYGWSIPQGNRVWTWEKASDFRFEGFNGAIGWVEPASFFNIFPKTLRLTDIKNTLVKFAKTDTAGNVLDPNDPDWSYAHRYLRNATAAPAKPEFAPFIKNRPAGYAYQEYFKSVPFSVWDVEADPPRRLMVGHLENNATGGMVDGKYWPPSFAAANNTNSSGPREWFFIFDVAYNETPDPRMTKDILNNPMPILWWGTPARNGDVAFQPDDEFLIQALHVITSRDVWTFSPTVVGIDDSENQPYVFELAQNYPNPYGRLPFNPTTQISFSIPVAAAVTLKIYNLLGQEVATLVDEKLAAGKHSRAWNGIDRHNRPVTSGIYFFRLTAGELVSTKKMMVLR
jgi:hypothetical protein